MQSRRRLLPLFGLLFTTLASAAITAACSGDDKTVYIYVTADSGTEASVIHTDSGPTVIPGDDDDAGDTSCTPGAAAAYTFVPAPRYQNLCTADQVTAILTD